MDICLGGYYGALSEETISSSYGSVDIPKPIIIPDFCSLSSGHFCLVLLFTRFKWYYSPFFPLEEPFDP